MRVSGCNDDCKSIAAIAAIAPSRSSLVEATELALVKAKATRNIDAQLACIDLLDVLQGRALASRGAVGRFRHHLGVTVPSGPYAAFAMAP